MELSRMNSAIIQRDQALLILNSKLKLISKLYRECYLSMNKGALLVYARNVIERGLPNESDYRTKEEILDVFDAAASHAKLENMINNYDQKIEGILVLITSYSNATFFVTVKLN